MSTLDTLDELYKEINHLKDNLKQRFKMIQFLDPDYFEINTNEKKKFKGGAKRKQPDNITDNRKTKKNMSLKRKKSLLVTDIRKEKTKLRKLRLVLDNILEDTFFCFRKKHQGRRGEIKFKKMFRDILEFIFTKDIRLHTMMNLLYEFLIEKETKKFKENVIFFFNFIIQKNLDINADHIDILINNTNEDTVIDQIKFLMTKIPNLFKILNYYKIKLTNNYDTESPIDNQSMNISIQTDTNKYIYMLLKDAMDKIIKLKTYDSTTTNQYEEYLQLKFTEFMREKEKRVTPHTPQTGIKIYIQPPNTVNRPGPGTKMIGGSSAPDSSAPVSSASVSSAPVSSASVSSAPVSNTLLIELFIFLGRAITDKDYEEDSKHDELLGGTANEDKAIEQCDAFDFIIEKSQFCISDIDYKIKENHDKMIETFDDSIMIFDAGPGIIKPLKYDPWLSRQKGQDNSTRKHVHPLQYQSYD